MFYLTKKNKKGSLTCEAALVTPLFILAVYGIICLMQIINTGYTMQIALNQTVIETGEYITAYVKTDLKEEAQKTEEYINTYIMEILYELSNVFDSKEEKHDQESICDTAGLFLLNVAEDLIKDEVTEIFLKTVMSKYITGNKDCEVNDILSDRHIVGGLKGLNFTGSKILGDGQTIKIVLNYQIEPRIPLGCFIRINMKHCSMIYPWQEGLNKESEIKDVYSVWRNMTPVDRGNYILQKEKSIIESLNRDMEIIYNNNSYFKVGVLKNGFDNFEQIINIRSIDYSLDSYQNKNAFIKTITDELKMVKDMKLYKDKVKKRTIYTNAHTKRVLILVLPESENPPVNEIEICKKEAAEMGVFIEVKYAYGCPKNVK